MPIYADTSALVALFHPQDCFSAAVNSRVQRHSPAVLYPPWLRFEVRHILEMARTGTYGETGWMALLAAERHVLKGVKDDWLTVIQSATALSSRYSKSHPCGAVDVLHVASALAFNAEEFWTCDEAQAEFAKATGLKTVLFTSDS